MCINLNYYLLCICVMYVCIYYIGIRMRIMLRAKYWKNSMNNHVILKGVDVEVIKVIQLASEVHN